MEVGDSFFLEGRTSYIGTSNTQLAGKKFVQRMVDGGLRVWRVE